MIAPLINARILLLKHTVLCLDAPKRLERHTIAQTTKGGLLIAGHIYNATKLADGSALLTQDNWQKACTFDNIDPASKFVVFSKENPYQ